MPFALPSFYPILDSSFLPAEPAARESFLRSLCAELIAAGVTLLQYRNKYASDDVLLADAAILRECLPPGQCTLILNDRPHLVASCGFDGVHIGQDDLHPAETRSLIGSARVLGLSTHSPAQIRAAEATTADYLAIGPVFATVTKQNPDPIVGLEGVRLARSLTAKPLVAIGGITIANATSVLRAGADAVAVISALFAADSGQTPAAMARAFLALT